MFRFSSQRLSGVSAVVTVATGFLLNAAVYSQSSAQSNTDNGHPYCQSADSDADGDGWGWENDRSCIVTGSSADKVLEPLSNCPRDQLDTDGDGFGWHNGSSCRILPTCRLASSDPDGDGYGWQDNESCIVRSDTTDDNNTANNGNDNTDGFSKCLLPDSDADGDGYGYEDGKTCLAEADTTPEPTEPTAGLPICVGSDSDPDGDGYGYENGQSCLMPAPPTSGATPGRPVCQSADSDPDGDGFGYENGQTCTVEFGKTADNEYRLEDVTEVIVITGQSNALGSQTEFDETLDAPHERVFAYTDDGWQIADLHLVWDDNAHPGNNSLNNPSRRPYNNLAFQFAKSVAIKSPNRVPAFIVDADPGKGIANWDYNSSFYRKLTSKIKKALNEMPHKSSVDAILWHQGENDWLYEGTSDPGATGFTSKGSNEYKNYYAIKLNSLINNFRNEPWARSDTPFICGETRRATGVNRRLMALNSDADPLTACVPATDLPARVDDSAGSHFSGAGLRTLGQRYADKYLEITGG